MNFDFKQSGQRWHWGNEGGQGTSHVAIWEYEISGTPEITLPYYCLCPRQVDHDTLGASCYLRGVNMNNRVVSRVWRFGTFFYIVLFDLQVFSESDKASKMEDKEEKNKLILADSPEVLKSKSSTLLFPETWFTWGIEGPNKARCKTFPWLVSGVRSLCWLREVWGIWIGKQHRVMVGFRIKYSHFSHFCTENSNNMENPTLIYIWLCNKCF